MRPARRRRLVFLLLLLALAPLRLWSQAGAASPTVPDQADADLPVITTMAQFWAIPGDKKDLPHYADLEITATFYDPVWRLLWGVDAGGADYLTIDTASPNLRSGDRFKVSGRFIPSRGVPLATAHVTLLGRPPLPEPLLANGDLANGVRFNGRLVTVDAYVDHQQEQDGLHYLLTLAVDGVPVQTQVLTDENAPIPQLTGALVRITGIYAINQADLSAPPSLWVPQGDHIKVLGWLDRDERFTRPALPIERIASAPANQLVRVLGTVQSQVPGKSLVVRDGTGQLTIETGMAQPVAPGTLVEALGHPDTRGLESVLRQSLFRVVATDDAPAPAATDRGLSVLRLAEQVRRLKAPEANRGYPARLRGVVVWSRADASEFHLLDASGTVRVSFPRSQIPVPALAHSFDLVGRTISEGFAPGVIAESLSPLGPLPRPEPRAITLEQAMTGIEEGQWVSLTGYVRALRRSRNDTRLSLTTSAGEFVAVLPRNENTAALEGAVVELHGICRATTDANGQLTGIQLWVADQNDVRIQERPPADPFALPLRSIASLRQFNTLEALNRRVHVAGVVLHHEPGLYLQLQDEEQSLTVLSRDPSPLAPGDRVAVVGFPGRQGERFVLREAVYRRISAAREPAPLPLDSADIAPAQLDGRLVRIVAHLASVSRRPDGARLVGEFDGTLFEALLPRRFGDPPDTWQPGSRAALTGVYVTQFDHNAAPHGFQLQLRTPDDVAILAAPPWWTTARTRTVAAGLALGTVLAFAWVIALRRRVRHQTDQIRAQLENAARLEGVLVRSSKLESLGVLAGGIAHDFNNLLTVVLGNISLVLGDRRLDGEDARFLREGERAALRARDLTQQLLTFAKGGSPIRSAVLLADIVREAAAFALHGSKVRPEFKFASGLWPAHVDRGQIGQVVHNIAINAVQAMPTGGTLEFTLRNEHIGADSHLPLEPGRFIALSIRDTGSGIGADHLARIFDPYFTTKQQGSGLGLATVHSIVKKHLGHIDVVSRLGHGTTFHLWLPAAETTLSPEPTPPSTPPQLVGRVLLMDDEPGVRAMASAMLRRLGLLVTAVADGQAAIDAYEQARDDGEPFSLVMVDLTVPGGMGGAEAVARLRLIDPAVRAIVSSGYSNDPTMADYRSCGFLGRVPKPYEFDELARVIASALPDSASAERSSAST